MLDKALDNCEVVTRKLAQLVEYAYLRGLVSGRDRKLAKRQRAHMLNATGQWHEHF